ncbi:MAG: hypothetical protein AAGF96_10555 [Bacteroidota bacterium]
MRHYKSYKLEFSNYHCSIKIIKVFLIIVTASATLLSCSNDNDENENDNVEIEQLDLSVLTGRYKGVWTWEIGDGAISMIITPTETATEYDVQYFESNNYRPRRRLDGVSPDARGSLSIDGMNVSIDLDHVVDDPPCPGTFSGVGTFNDTGELNLEMIIDDCFATNEPASWKLEKKEDL